MSQQYTPLELAQIENKALYALLSAAFKVIGQHAPHVLVDLVKQLEDVKDDK